MLTKLTYKIHHDNSEKDYGVVYVDENGALYMLSMIGIILLTGGEVNHQLGGWVTVPPEGVD